MADPGVFAAQLCEVLAQTLVGFRKLVSWRTRLEPGKRLPAHLR